MDYKNKKFFIYNGCDRGLCLRGCGRQDRQLNTYDWLADVPGNAQSTDLVEVQFKIPAKDIITTSTTLTSERVTSLP